MYTQCPHCQAYFEVTADQLKVGEGDVRCGQCLSIFNALQHLTEQLPNDDEDNDANQYAEWTKNNPTADITAPATDGTNETATRGVPATAPAVTRSTSNAPWPDLGNIDAVAAELDPHIGTPRRHNTFDTTDELTSQQIEAIELPDDWLDESPKKILADTLATDKTQKTDSPEPSVDSVMTENTPLASTQQDSTKTSARKTLTGSLATETGRPDAEQTATPNLPAPLLRQLQEEKAASLHPPATLWVIGSLLMLMLFLAQASYFYRDELALRKPELRPWLEQACSYLDCNLRPPIHQGRIDILGWDVRSQPNTPQALIASTTLVNKTTEPQPYPLLTLRFSDMNGASIAQRRFLPREYLSAGTDIQAGMAPDTPVVVELALVDPGKQAINFEFHTETAKLAQ
ncbi:MAG: zinc-ribbon domain-containing protein [Gammaproteobacteria bacterium]|nr:zinc-ribbon domain-containing protein [Gammaproteobacteria bacterium]